MVHTMSMLIGIATGLDRTPHPARRRDRHAPPQRTATGTQHRQAAGRFQPHDPPQAARSARPASGVPADLTISWFARGPRGELAQWQATALDAVRLALAEADAAGRLPALAWCSTTEGVTEVPGLPTPG